MKPSSQTSSPLAEEGESLVARSIFPRFGVLIAVRPLGLLHRVANARGRLLFFPQETRTRVGRRDILPERAGISRKFPTYNLCRCPADIIRYSTARFILHVRLRI